VIDESIRQEIRRIVVRSTNWVGDALMCTPVYRALKLNYPDAHLAVIARPWMSALLEGNPNVDQVIGEEEKGYKGVLSTRTKLLGQEPFDLGIALPNSLGSAIGMWAGKVKHRVGFNVRGRHLFLNHAVDRPEWLLRQHQVEYYLYLLREWCESFDDVRHLEYFVSDAEKQEVRSILVERWSSSVLNDGLILGVAPGAAFGTAKRWPWQRYAEVIKQAITQWGAHVLLIGSKTELEAAEQITRQIESDLHDKSSNLYNTVGQFPLRISAALVNKCHSFLTNDSGAMHLAAALDIPQLAIFGPTDWVTTPPYSNKAHIIRKPTECSPCLLRHCPIDHRCMEKILGDEVFQKWGEVIREEAAEAA
jgi:heptosyltransferase-2